MPTSHAFRYNLHDLMHVKLVVTGCGPRSARLIDSKLAAFATAARTPPDVTMEIGPFRPQIPPAAVVIDKDFHCAPDYVFFRGAGGRGATEIRGFLTPPTTIRHVPYAEAPWRRPLAGLRGVNLYLEPLIKLRLLARTPSAFLIHGAAVARDGQALVLFGTNGAHKTRLVLDLCLHHGFRFLADDLTLLDDGQALVFAEHPQVLAARTAAVRRGRPATVSAWRLAARILLGLPRRSPEPPPMAARAPVGMAALVDRGTDIAVPALAPVSVEQVWQRARRLEQLEMSKAQRRFRQVTNSARLLMAYEYAFPGNVVFASALLGCPPMPSWLSVPALQVRMPVRYSRSAAAQLAAEWRRGRVAGQTAAA